MKTPISVPHVAIAAGMPGRYRYWTGQSGARYLFTQVAAKSLDDFDDGVFLLVRFGTVETIGDRSAISAALAEMNAEAIRNYPAVAAAINRDQAGLSIS